MDQSQRDKLTALLASQHLATLVTNGEPWPTATMQAFAETPDLDLIFIMNDATEKYRNLLARPNVSILVDARDTGDIPTFRVVRALIQGIAADVPRDSAEWQKLEKIFLAKNPFESPFFKSPALRMVAVKTRRFSYTGADHVNFKAEL